MTGSVFLAVQALPRLRRKALPRTAAMFRTLVDSGYTAIDRRSTRVRQLRGVPFNLKPSGGPVTVRLQAQQIGHARGPLAPTSSELANLQREQARCPRSRRRGAPSKFPTETKCADSHIPPRCSGVACSQLCTAKSGPARKGRRDQAL